MDAFEDPSESDHFRHLSASVDSQERMVDAISDDDHVDFHQEDDSVGFGVLVCNVDCFFYTQIACLICRTSSLTIVLRK